MSTAGDVVDARDILIFILRPGSRIVGKAVRSWQWRYCEELLSGRREPVLRDRVVRERLAGEWIVNDDPVARKIAAPLGGSECLNTGVAWDASDHQALKTAERE